MLSTDDVVVIRTDESSALSEFLSILIGSGRGQSGSTLTGSQPRGIRFSSCDPGSGQAPFSNQSQTSCSLPEMAFSAPGVGLARCSVS